MGISIFACILCALIQPAHAAQQDVVITEIAASLPDHFEWVEIFNLSKDPVDVSDWRFVEGFTEQNPDGVRHKLKPIQGGGVIPAHEYAVIAQDSDAFLREHKNYSGILMDSSWNSLKESGERIHFLDGSGIVHEDFVYVSAQAGILTRIDFDVEDYSAHNWIELTGQGTPGMPNNIKHLSEEEASMQTNGNEEPSAGESAGKTLYEDFHENQKNIIQEHETMMFHIPVGDTYLCEWNFDDGTTKRGCTVEHVFQKEGDYHVRLSAKDADLGEVNLVYKITVLQKPPPLADIEARFSEQKKEIVSVKERESLPGETIVLEEKKDTRAVAMKYTSAVLVAVLLVFLGLWARKKKKDDS